MNTAHAIEQPTSPQEPAQQSYDERYTEAFECLATGQSHNDWLLTLAEILTDTGWERTRYAGTGMGAAEAHELRRALYRGGPGDAQLIGRIIYDWYTTGIELLAGEIADGDREMPV